nr:reverse transcriptase domain-containing protein [Tanacetum cinerariifolium]
MLFPYSLEDRARIWYEKEPPNSILTWDDLVKKFVNQFFPPSKTTHLKNEISRFTQRFNETFSEAWNRFKELLRAYLHHRFSELTQIDTFYNGLTEQDQDSLNAASGGNLLNKTTREALQIIENKSKVRYSRSKSNVSRVNTNSKDVVSKTDDRIDKLADQISNLVEIVNKQVIALAKAVEKTCVTCGGAHAYYECIATDSNPSSVCAATGSYNHVSPPNRASHQIPPPGFASVQNNPNRFNQGSTAQVQPPVVPISILEPNVLRTQSKPSIPYPSRLNDQKLREKATNQMEKFFQIFHDLHFDISFANDLLLMQKFALTIKSLLANKEKLLTDPKVPLILRRSFLRTGRALIDVYGEEITLRVNDKSITFNLDQVMRYFDNSVSRVNVINIASEEVVHDNPKSINPTLVFESDFREDPIVKTSSFGESDFFSEEIEYCLKDGSIPIEIKNSVFDPEGDIILIEKLLNEEPFKLPPMNLNQEKSPIKEPEYSFSIGYEYFITTPVTELDEVAESSAKNLVPIPREHEVTSDNKSEYNEPIKDDSSLAFTTLINPLFNDKDDFTIHDEDVTIKYLMDMLITINPCPRFTVNADMIVESLPSSLIPVQDNDSQREEIVIVTDTDELLPPGFENDDSEGETYVLEELRVDNSISNSENELSDNEASDFDNPSFLRPPPEPPDVEFDFDLDAGEEILVVMNDNDELECLDPRDEIDISTNDEDDDYFPFMFVIRIFLPYFIYPKVFPLLLSAESEDTIFDPGISV